MLQQKNLQLLTLTIVALISLTGCGEPAGNSTSAAPSGPEEVRLGYFANLTHAQGVLGVSSGEFEQAAAPARFSTKVFNAGPSLIEAIFAGEVDIGYIGPGPAITAHIKSRGQGVRVIAGAAANGVLIVARNGSGIQKLEDLAGKRVATPQHGNTQDIAARHFLSAQLKQENLNNVLPITNAEQSAMMARGEIDAAWAPEPWGSRLIAETGASLIAEEKDLWPDKEFILTVIITTPEFLSEHPDVVEKILKVHTAWTKRLQDQPETYVPQLESALFALNNKKLPPGVLQSALKYTKFTDDILPETFQTMAQWSYELHFAQQPPNLQGLIDDALLRKAKQ